VTIAATANGLTVTQQLAVQSLTVQSVVMKQVTVVGGTPAAADAFIGKQIDIWAKVVKDNGIKAD
jgi:hypothetical protein